ncbi:MAG TPA: protein kinase [Pyrinomonadaceae bacterium]
MASLKQDHNFLESPVFGLSAADLAAKALDDDEESLAGEQVGPYRLVREIGRGGMGVVYLAERADGHYQQQVALKVIKRGMDSRDVVRRFRRERQILANLTHQNISKLLDGGTTADGLPYFVIEHVEGLPIDEYSRVNCLSLRKRLELFLDACAAVQYAHDRKVMHRDLKPDNILITSDGTAKLLDFGIAKFLDGDQSTSTRTQTDTALRLFTPEYASPEQLRGTRLSEASDVYSLGMVLYKLLTGRHPYRLDSREPNEILKSLADTELERPSTAVGKLVSGRNGISNDGVDGPDRPETLRGKLRGDLDNIILMALRKEPERRYASVEQFAEDIRRHLDRLPVRARRDTVPYRGFKFFKRNKTVALTALILSLVCLLLVIALTMNAGRTKPTTSVALLPFVNASGNPEMEHIAEGVTEQLIADLSGVTGLSVSARDSAYSFKGRTVEARTVGRALDAAHVLTGRVTSDGAHLAISVTLIHAQSNQPIWNEQYVGKPSDILAMQKEIVWDLTRKLDLQLAADGKEQTGERHTRDAAAYLAYLKGRYFWNKRGPQNIELASQNFGRAISIDPDYALAYSGLADCYTLLGIYTTIPPKDAMGKAQTAALKALELDGRLAEAHASLAGVKWLFEWDWKGADREFLRAIELNPNSSSARHWYGLYLAEMGRFEEAIAEERRALELDPLSLVINADMGRVLYYARRYKESLEQYRKTLQMDPADGTATADIIYVYELMGRNDEWFSAMEHFNGVATSALREAYLAGGIKGYWRKRLEVWNVRRDPHFYPLAEIYTRVGEKDKAFEMLNQAYDEQAHGMAQLRVNPIFDPLRSDPRFSELLRRMNLQP